MTADWDVRQYERYRDERSRPFFDLLARVPLKSARSIVDLGCGSGELTRALLDRWPDATVTGVDTSDEMLAAAAPRAIAGRLEFVRADVATWSPPRPVDLLLSNAALQWVPDHDRLVPRLVAMLAPGGALAVQMPANFAAPSHTLLTEIAGAGPWAARFRETWRAAPAQPLQSYISRLQGLGCSVDAWETVYHHVLQGPDAVLEWMKGTGARPALALLEEADRPAFLAMYAKRLRDVYPETPQGTILPFRRIFFVAARAPA